MDNVDYIDWDEREFPDASCSVAVNECGNCGHTAERLTLVPEFNYMGCDDCMEEAMKIIAADAIDAACLADRKAITAARAAQPNQFAVVERWNGQQWTEHKLEWNGTEYKEVA